MDVIVPVDGSKHSQWALDWVAQLPFSSSTNVKALHVVDLVSLRAPLTPHPVIVWNEAIIQAETKRLIAEAKRIAAQTKEQLSARKLKAKVVVERGAVSPAILKHARKKASLIVMGSRGLNALDRFILGSVSGRVVHHAACSVLIVKQPARPLRRILFATDGSRESGKAINFLQKHLLPIERQEGGRTGGVEVIVMHVMPFLRYPELKETGRSIVAHAAKRLQKAGFRTEEVPRVGNPADEIITAAEQREVDLIVSGARGLGAVARFFLGSTSTKVLHHSHCSVLIVR